ncbi:hypothetical protein V8J82_08125 [Gymnodinialimonas sp. 2305UL16-5]|uniref:hypothetical protein n=1 Tax=Gymnodinialimonas mytili TaxID=3126503 RepID=UPI0030B4332E
MVVIATPSLLIPGTTTEGAQMVTLVALILGVFTAIEYGARYPGLVEFRDAAPFNRVRVIALLLMLFGCSAIAGFDPNESTLVMVISALGFLVGRALDFGMSPLTLVLEHLPQGVNSRTAEQVQAMAGLSMLITLIALFIFSALIRLERWPNRNNPFNVWVNLPTFDPTAGGDVIKRLRRDGQVNIIFGLFAPFVIPVVAVMGANQLQVPVLASPHTMVWAIVIWMFLPLSLVMRGQAMLRISNMIRARRARLVAGLNGDQPVDISASAVARSRQAWSWSALLPRRWRTQ